MLNYQNFNLLNLISFLPELFILTNLLILFIWSIFLANSERYKVIQKDLLSKLSLLLIEVFIISFILFFQNIKVTNIIFYNTLIIDTYSTTIKLIIIFFSIIFLTLFWNYLNQYQIEKFEFPILIGFSIFAMLILVSSYDFITLYLSLELQALSFYILAAFKKNMKFSIESGIKYFILSALSSGLLLFGISLIYGFTGSTNFEDLAKFFLNDLYYLQPIYNNLIIGLIFIIISFLFKLTAVPFHMWAPDVYEGAPLPVTIFFMTIPKIAIFSILIKILFWIFFDLIFIWKIILINSAIITLIFASIAAVYQKKIKRFLTYSAISQIGYLLIGLSLGLLKGIQALFIYLIIYIITIFATFSFLLSVKKIYKPKRVISYLSELTYLQNLPTFYKLGFICLFFSMAGIPPLVGFFIKFYLFLTTVEISYLLLITFGILVSMISTFYYIRIIKITFFDKIQTKNINMFSNEINNNAYIYIFLLLLILLFICSPNYFFLKIYQLTLYI